MSHGRFISMRLFLLRRIFYFRLRVLQELPVVPRAHVAGGGDEVDVEVEVLVLLEVRRLEPELARVHR